MIPAIFLLFRELRDLRTLELVPIMLNGNPKNGRYLEPWYPMEISPSKVSRSQPEMSRMERRADSFLEKEKNSVKRKKLDI
jgi:hypothetical protein